MAAAHMTQRRILRAPALLRGVALAAALLANWWLAKAGILTLTGQTQGILFILVIGAATDYSLLYTARYAEELKRREHRADATRAALRGVIEPILASGGTRRMSAVTRWRDCLQT